jgi:hypothetical protein
VTAAKLRVAVQGGHQFVTVAWSTSDTKLEVNCSCSKAAEMKHCPHLWAGLLELDRHKAVRTMPTRGNVVLAFVDPPALPPQAEKPASRPTSTSCVRR